MKSLFDLAIARHEDTGEGEFIIIGTAKGGEKKKLLSMGTVDKNWKLKLEFSVRVLEGLKRIEREGMPSEFYRYVEEDLIPRVESELKELEMI